MPNDSRPVCVNFANLRCPDGTVYLYDMKPFTGTAVVLDSSGRVESESTFVQGARLGWTREWDPETGQLLAESDLRDTFGSGVHRRWHPLDEFEREATPLLASETEVEFGIKVRERRWDEFGDLVSDVALTEADPHFGLLESLRKIYSRGGG